MIDPDGHDCAWCPARRFTSRQALADHERQHELADLAARPRDPLDVLRDAPLWAQDEGALCLAPEDLALIDIAALAPGKPIPGYCAVLRHNAGNATARVALAIDGRSLAVLVVRTAPATSMRLRVQLPAGFAVPVDRPPVLRNSRALAERLAEAAAQGLADERAEVMQ